MTNNEIQAFMNDYWKMLLKPALTATEYTDSFWTEVFNQQHALEEKYKHEPYAVDILVAGIDEFWRRSKKGGKNEQRDE